MDIDRARQRQRRTCRCVLGVGGGQRTRIAGNRPVLGARRRIADAGGHHRRINRWRTGRACRPAPVEFIILRLARKVRAVAQRHLFIQRIARTDDFQIARVELIADFKHFDLDRIARRRKGLAVAKYHRHIACTLARCRQRVAIDGRVGIFNRRDHRRIGVRRLIGPIPRLEEPAETTLQRSDGLDRSVVAVSVDIHGLGGGGVDHIGP